MQKIGVLTLVCLTLGACHISLLPSKDAWYTQHYIIMQDFERETYKKLSLEGKQEFQKLFWEFRTQDSRITFLERLDFVMKFFKKENSLQPWNTDRSRIYLLNGSPASIEYQQLDDWGMQVGTSGRGTEVVIDRSKEDIQGRTGEVWTYFFGKSHINYVFIFSKPKNWILSQRAFAGNEFLGALEMYSKEQIYGIIDKEQYIEKLENLKKIK